MNENWWSQQARKIAVHGLTFSLKRLMSTLDVRLSHYDRTADPALPEFTSRAIYVFWHEYIAFPISLWGHYNVAMLASQHRDADWVSLAAAPLGFGVVRGSTTRGGSRAVRQLKRLAQTMSLAITPDGPRGPRRELALGPVYLSSRLQIPLVPVGFGFQYCYRFSTWDRFAVPYPGCRARAVMGPRMQIPAKIGKDSLEAHRQYVESTLRQLTETAESWAASGSRMQGEQVFRRYRPRLAATAIPDDTPALRIAPGTESTQTHSHSTTTQRLA